MRIKVPLKIRWQIERLINLLFLKYTYSFGHSWFLLWEWVREGRVKGKLFKSGLQKTLSHSKSILCECSLCVTYFLFHISVLPQRRVGARHVIAQPFSHIWLLATPFFKNNISLSFEISHLKMCHPECLKRIQKIEVIKPALVRFTHYLHLTNVSKSPLSQQKWATS